MPFRCWLKPGSINILRGRVPGEYLRLHLPRGAVRRQRSVTGRGLGLVTDLHRLGRQQAGAVVGEHVEALLARTHLDDDQLLAVDLGRPGPRRLLGAGLPTRLPGRKRRPFWLRRCPTVRQGRKAQG